MAATRRTGVPGRHVLDGLEEKWSGRWEEQGTHAFDATRAGSRTLGVPSRPFTHRGSDEGSGGRPQRVFSIDTPPLTTSDAPHLRHVVPFTRADIVARFHRMHGKEVFHAFGWHDDDVPAEHRAHSRQTHVQVWRRLGVSADLTGGYRTTDTATRAVAQLAFLRDLARGEAYQTEAPTFWDPAAGSVVGPAERVARRQSGHLCQLLFRCEDGAVVSAGTTRPELLPACAALVVHPDDARHRHLIGRTVRTPVFGVAVPVHGHRLVDPGKGTGVAMVCTFGDTLDVACWRELRLPTRQVIDPHGHLVTAPPPGVDTPHARAAYAHLAGATVPVARERMLALLRCARALHGTPRTLTRTVMCSAAGDAPLEILLIRQWYLRDGGTDPDLRERLLRRGRELDWHPPRVRVRYESVAGALGGDRPITGGRRARGVPLPVWYPLDADGRPDHTRPLVPEESALPVDPGTQPPPGYTAHQRDAPGGFRADGQVMDPWAIASLGPQIAAGWPTDPELFARVFPMDLRFQDHESLRPALFATVLRSHTELGTPPWRHVAVSGRVRHRFRSMRDVARGVPAPAELMDRYGADAVRYWAASAPSGGDVDFADQPMERGRKLATKLLNVGRLVLGDGTRLCAAAPGGGPDADVSAVTEPVDRALLGALAAVVADATTAFAQFDPARALSRSERFFRRFCADYAELVKARAFGEQGHGASGAATRSARAALRTALGVLLRLFAPVLPFATEEVWSWRFDGSVHLAAWPEATRLARAGEGADGALLTVAADALTAVRRVRSMARLPSRAPLVSVVVTAPRSVLDRFALVASDVRAAGRIGTVEQVAADGDGTGRGCEGGGLTVEVRR